MSLRITWCVVGLGEFSIGSSRLTQLNDSQDIEGLDALMAALKVWNGGVIVISHDTRFIET